MATPVTDAYDRHLAALHGGFEAPPELIAEAARELTPSPIAAQQRIVHGEANEVYGLIFESGLEVILRIARRAEGLFEKEAWAIGRCRALGMKVPEILSIQRREASGEMLELCFMQRLPGRRLLDSLDLPRDVLRSIVRELGEQISRMHTIGWDDLGEAVRFFENDTDDFLAMEPEFVERGMKAGLDRRALERAIRHVAARRSLLPPRLTHNDFRPCHVLVHEGRLSGLIDFGEISMDTPINEFAKWDFWAAPELPAAWLQEGYGDRTLFDGDYPDLFAAYRIANALWVLRWYSITGYAAGTEQAAARLAGYLGEIGAD